MVAPNVFKIGPDRPVRPVEPSIGRRNGPVNPFYPVSSGTGLNRRNPRFNRETVDPERFLTNRHGDSGEEEEWERGGFGAGGEEEEWERGGFGTGGGGFGGGFDSDGGVDSGEVVDSVMSTVVDSLLAIVVEHLATVVVEHLVTVVAGGERETWDGRI